MDDADRLKLDVLWHMESAYRHVSELRWQAAMQRVQGNDAGARSYETRASEVQLVLDQLEHALEKAKVLPSPKEETDGHEEQASSQKA